MRCSTDRLHPSSGNAHPLRGFLDELQAQYHRSEYLGSDPLEFVHRYSDPWDQEVVALVAALLAYGNVKQIRKSVEALLGRMEALSGGSPARFVRGLREPGRLPAARGALKGFVHRFNVGEDLLLLLELVAESWEVHGSVGAHFLGFLKAEDEDIGRALGEFIGEWRLRARALGPDQRRRGARASFAYLLTSPGDGSCCKRWCMLLRWMGRKDELDPGLWSAEAPAALARTFPRGARLRPDQLVLPLDTHTGRISQYLELTTRKHLGWQAACEITRALKRANPEDPTRYDFALARLGILDLCQRRYREEICERCALLPACRFARGRGSVRMGRRKPQTL